MCDALSCEIKIRGRSRSSEIVKDIHDIIKINPPQQHLTSRKPLWCAMTPNDIKSQRRESWKSAPVRLSVPTDSTIRQPGFTLPLQQWSLLKRFHTSQGHWHCGACRKTCALQTLICAPMVRPKWCPTSSNPALLPSWMVASASLCWCCCYWLVDQFWILSHMQEELEIVP